MFPYDDLCVITAVGTLYQWKWNEVMLLKFELMSDWVWANVIKTPDQHKY